MIDTVELYKPFAHQRAVHAALTYHINTEARGHNRFQKTFVVISRRQVGKSALAQNELLRFALHFRSSTNAYITTSFRLCKKMFEEIEAMLSGAHFVEEINKTDLTIKFTNKSRIDFFSAEQRDKLRGFTVSGILVIDEAAFIPDEVYHSRVKVWTNARRAVTLMLSSPDFENGFFYEQHQEALKGSPYVSCFDFNDFDLSEIQSPEALEEARRTVPPQVFRSEYLGLYRKAEGSVFGNFENQIMRHTPEAPEKLFFGIDFGTGSGGDYTVLAGFNEKRELCYLWRNNDMQPVKQVAHIGNILAKYKAEIKGCLAEENSIGKIYLNLLKNHGHVQPFNTNAKSKRKIIETLQVDIQNGSVWFPDDRALKNEFSMFECKQKGVNLSYSAPDGEHDDIVMAVAIANWCYKTKNSPTRISIL